LFLIAALGLLATSALGTPSQAASVTYDSSVVPLQSIPFSYVLSLPKFDPSLGTLTGVTLSVDASVLGMVQIFNISGTTKSFTNATASVPMTATGPGGVVATTTATAVVASGTAAPGLNSYPPVLGLSQGLAPVAPVNFGLYEGVGTFNGTLAVTAASGTFGGTGGGGSLFFGGTAEAGGAINVEYTYTPSVVPEPTSMALLGIGMTSFLAFRRFFSKRTPNA
jgi:hypothetical protein